MSFKAAEQRKLIKQLREKAESLKQSRDECAKSFELCNSGLADMRAEVTKAKDLADFYEKQAAENEMLAQLFRQVLIALAECKVDITDLTLVPDKIKQVVTARNGFKELLESSQVFLEKYPEFALTENCDKAVEFLRKETIDDNYIKDLEDALKAFMKCVDAGYLPPDNTSAAYVKAKETLKGVKNEQKDV